MEHPAATATTAALATPVVTIGMLTCQLCSLGFSMSGSLSDHRTPVLAVNPSQSIEGPYCIACAGQRDGLKGFLIDEARVALCKLVHQQQMEAVAYATKLRQQPLHHAHHPRHLQQHDLDAVTGAGAGHQQNIKAKDAPGKTSTVHSRGEQLHLFNNNNSSQNLKRAIIFNKDMRASAGNTHHQQQHQQKRQKQTSSNYAKTSWTQAEDDLVIDAVQMSEDQPFSRWSELAQALPGRIGKQIRDRWLNHLDPKIDRSPFSREEDVKLYEAFKQHGKRWVEISNKYYGSKRSENHIKNRWYSAAFKKFVRRELNDPAFETNTPVCPSARAMKQQGITKAIASAKGDKSSNEEGPAPIKSVSSSSSSEAVAAGEEEKKDDF